MEQKRVNVALIASGSGTDADAIMKAGQFGRIPYANIKVLISTKPGAGCLDKANSLNIQTKVIEHNSRRSLDDFNAELAIFLKENDIELVFLVGCIVKIYPIKGVIMYNIHPADPHKHGGDYMYDLKVHSHVILEINDMIRRGKVKGTDKFYTYPTVHEAVMEYDAGDILLQAAVEIPPEIINGYGGSDHRPDTLKMFASELQRHVLPYEWIMLPTAVQMAAKKILDQRRVGHGEA